MGHIGVLNSLVAGIFHLITARLFLFFPQRNVRITMINDNSVLICSVKDMSLTLLSHLAFHFAVYYNLRKIGKENVSSQNI